MQGIVESEGRITQAIAGKEWEIDDWSGVEMPGEVRDVALVRA